MRGACTGFTTVQETVNIPGLVLILDKACLQGRPQLLSRFQEDSHHAMHAEYLPFFWKSELLLHSRERLPIRSAPVQNSFTEFLIIFPGGSHFTCCWGIKCVLRNSSGTGLRKLEAGLPQTLPHGPFLFANCA